MMELTYIQTISVLFQTDLSMQFCIYVHIS